MNSNIIGMEKFVYIMACKRGQGLPEIHYVCDSYNEAIKAYYHYHLKDNRGFLESRNRDYWFMNLYKFPVSTDFAVEGHSWSKVKLGKSCKYRVKFNTWGDLIDEYKVCNRDMMITDLISE